MKQKENAAVYSLEAMGKLPELVDELSGSEKKMQEIADNGFEMAQKSHTWEKRAMIILEFLRAMY